MENFRLYNRPKDLDTLRMRKIFTISLTIFLVCGLGLPTHGARALTDTTEQSQLLIVALQTSSTAGGASEKFIELFNPTESDVDATGWYLQYRSAASDTETAWRTKATVACLDEQTEGCKVMVAAHDWLLFSSYDDTAQPLTVTSSFATTGGQIRLMKPGQTTPQDSLQYGTAANKPAVAPKKGEVLQRKIDTTLTFVDTNDDTHDFTISCNTPTPGEHAPLEPTPEACPSDIPPSEDMDDTQPEDTDALTSYPPVFITELLPDPTSPKQDSTDEFIELYNPNSETVNLAGYEIQSGSNYRYKYTIEDTSLDPGHYVAITSSQSHLSLTNSGTSVRLLDPNGEVVDEIESYGSAKPGQSWVKTTVGTWQWSLTPTPNAQNALVQAAPKKPSTAPAKKSSSKTINKVASAKTTTAKTPADTSSSTVAATQASNPTNYWLLGALGALILGYGAYEYRKEIASRLTRLRGAFTKKSS